MRAAAVVCGMRFPVVVVLCVGWVFAARGGEDSLPGARPVPRVQATPMPHSITSFSLDGRELTACHYDPADRRVFWHPVRASRDVSLTRMGHPHDPLTHSHHNSVWISHHDVDGVDFWGDHGKTLGCIVCAEVSREGYTDSDELAAMQMVNHWVKDEDGSVMLVETRRAEVRPLEGAKSWFMIVDLEFTTPKGGKARFNPSGFGLIAVRMAKSIGVHDGGGRILNSEGQVNEEPMFRKPARWCDYSGRITNEADGFAGITLMNHPLNSAGVAAATVPTVVTAPPPPSPASAGATETSQAGPLPRGATPFHVRDDGWMGACLNLDSTLEVSEARKLRLRYGLWVHDGAAAREVCEARWRDFTSLPVADLAPRKK